MPLSKKFAAEFIGAANVVPLSDLRAEGGKARARTPWGEIYFLSNGPTTPRSIVIRPEDFQLVANLAFPNRLPLAGCL